MGDAYKNPVTECGQVLLIELGAGKIARADNTDAVKEILRRYRFRAIRRTSGSNYYYAVHDHHKGPRVTLHRFVMGDAVAPGNNVFHQDGDSLNCCRGNLEVRSKGWALMRGFERIHAHGTAKSRRKRGVTGIYRRPHAYVASWVNTKSGAKHYKLFSFSDSSKEDAYALAVSHQAKQADEK